MADDGSTNSAKSKSSNGNSGACNSTNSAGSDSSSKDSGVVGAVSAMTHIGITIAACIVIGVFIGRFLDKALGTQPALLIVFSLLGVISAFRTIMKAQIIKPDKAETQSEANSPGQTDSLHNDRSEE